MSNSSDNALERFLAHLGGSEGQPGSVGHASISPESLELMGKEAANMFLNEKVALNEGVAKIASRHQDISNEQIKRICEFANTAVYLANHDMNKTAKADSSYPQFELADPARVIQDLSDGARPTVITPTDVEYGLLATKKSKVASSKADDMLAELFGHHKIAGQDHYTVETAVQEVMDAKSSLNSLKENLQATGERFQMMYDEIKDKYYDLVKRHVMDGNDFSNVVAAGRSVESDEEKLASVLKPVVERLIMEKVARPSELKESIRGLSKIAHRVVNQKHPLVSMISDMMTLDGEIEKIAVGLQMVEEELGVIDNFIKENFRGRKASR